MIRPSFDLHKLPFMELLDDCLFLLEKDQEQLAAQSANYISALSAGKKSTQEMEKWKARLIDLQNRYEFLYALVCRVQAIDLLIIISAMSQASKEAVIRGTPGEFSLTVYVNPNVKPLILIH